LAEIERLKDSEEIENPPTTLKDQIKKLETENKKLAEVAKTEAAQKDHEKKLKEGALAEVERLNETFFKQLEKNIMSTPSEPHLVVMEENQVQTARSQPEFANILDATEEKITRSEKDVKDLQPIVDELNKTDNKVAQVALISKLKGQSLELENS
jgi:hypothetical protein